ncbi:hypothetical protein, partial [Desulfogranum marinum]|uniref:hypothetical protein n=1 Tax=Desulfogranum marinum TaxID=453220 RepID=UPI00196408E6
GRRSLVAETASTAVNGGERRHELLIVGRPNRWRMVSWLVVTFCQAASTTSRQEGTSSELGFNVGLGAVERLLDEV